MSWDRRFLALAAHIAGWSKDLHTQVGSVIVGPDREIVSTGFNGLPRGIVDDPIRMERPAKYLWTSHAEENAVAHAARTGVSLKGCTVYVTHCPCARCARSLIQAGVKRVVFDRKGVTSMPQEEFDVATAMFEEAGVILNAFDVES
jgi:dCMP deaminase